MSQSTFPNKYRLYGAFYAVIKCAVTSGRFDRGAFAEDLSNKAKHVYKVIDRDGNVWKNQDVREKILAAVWKGCSIPSTIKYMALCVRDVCDNHAELTKLITQLLKENLLLIVYSGKDYEGGYDQARTAQHTLTRASCITPCTRPPCTPPRILTEPPSSLLHHPSTPPPCTTSRQVLQLAREARLEKMLTTVREEIGVRIQLRDIVREEEFGSKMDTMVGAVLGEQLLVRAWVQVPHVSHPSQTGPS